MDMFVFMLEKKFSNNNSKSQMTLFDFSSIC